MSRQTIQQCVDFITRSAGPITRLASLTFFICAASFVLAFLLRDRTKPIFGSYDPATVNELGSLPSDRRIIRHTDITGKIMCVEPARSHVIFNLGDNKDDKNKGGGSQLALNDTPTSMLREGGWQLCNAYANGVITKEQYATSLLTMLQSKPETSLETARKNFGRKR